MTFGFHLGLETVDHLLLLLESQLLLGPLLTLLFVQLTVTALLLGHNFIVLLAFLLSLASSKQFDVLLHETVVHGLFVTKSFLASLLSFDLFVELSTNETTAFGFTHDGLLLFFEVQELVEFLDGGPLVIFSDFTVNLGGSSLG